MRVKGYSVHTGWLTEWLSRWRCVAVLLIFACRWTSTTCLEECPFRDVQSVRHNAATAELGLVLYYTSWHKASVAAHAIYAELAQYYYTDAYFGAIDCWHLRCNCSGTHAPVGAGSLGVPHTWPTLIAYYGRGAVTAQYHGTWDFASLSAFVENLSTPCYRMHTRDELRQLAARSDAVVLGLFPDTHTHARDRRQYNRFVLAAVKWLESDPDRNYRFAAALGTSATNMLSGVTDKSLPQILLISRTAITNFTLSASTQRWHVPQIVHWVQDELRRTFAQVYSKMTPTSLAIRLRHGHVLALLATDAELHQLIDGVLDFPSASVTFQACDSFWKHATDKADYLLYKQIQHNHIVPNERQCVANDELNWRTLGNYYWINAYLNQRFEQFMHKGNAEESLLLGELQADDVVSTSNLRYLYNYRNCLKHPNYSSQELRIATAKYMKKSIDKLFTNATAAHLHNRTLSLVILDAEKYRDYNFLNRGALHLHATSASAFIIDPQKENIFVMPERFSYDAIMHFVQHYYDGHPLTPHASSSLYRFTPTATQSLHIHEYNRDMFLQTVHRQQQQLNATTIVALLYSPECAYSSMFAHTLLQLSVFLNSNDITFMRVNTLANDLPWEFAMPVTPTLLVFPRGHYPESRVFPAHLNANVRNVLGFILAQLQPIEQVKLVLDSCKQAIVPSRQQQCLKFAKHLVGQHIGKSLHHWQIFENERHFILNRLKEFKDLSLNIQSSTRL